MAFSPLAKQIFVATAPQLAAVSMGGSLGYPCVLLQQFQSNETTIHTDLDTLTWIVSMHGISGIGATLMPAIMQLKGRKYSFIGSCLLLLIGWILAYVAMDILSVLLSAIFHGLASNCIAIVNLVTVSEMLAPKYRSASMILLIINQTLGQVLVVTLGYVMDWQTAAMLMCIPVIIALLMAIILPESPSWLAYKGKFEASEKAFIWLRGTDQEAKKELKALIAAQKEARRNLSKMTKVREMIQKIKRRDFYLPSLHMLLLLFNFYGSGGMSLFVYSKDVIETAIGDPKVAVIGYIVTFYTLLTGSCISFILIKFFKSKTVLSTALGCFVLLLCCASIPYLQTIGIVSKDSWLFLYFYLGFMMFANSGFNPVTYSLAIDLMPVKHRGIGGALFNLLTCFFFVLTVKTFPYVIQCITLSLTFVLYAVCCLSCIILIWIYIPETKNRTLQEIEDYYNYGCFVEHRDLDGDEVNTPIVKSSVELS